MENIVQQVNQQKHVAFIVVDFFQAFPLSGNSEAMKEIKRLAQTFNVPILVLSQLNRNLERRKDKRPYLNDIRGGRSCRMLIKYYFCIENIIICGGMNLKSNQVKRKSILRNDRVSGKNSVKT